MATQLALESLMIDRLSDSLPECQEALTAARGQLGLKPPTRESERRLAEEFCRRLPSFLVVCLVVAELPVLQGRFRQHFRKNAGLKPLADETSADTVVKLLNNFFGNWPRGNAGAYVATVASHVGVDAMRKAIRGGRLGRQHDAALLADFRAPDDAATLLIDLPSRDRDIINLRMDGGSADVIADRLGMTVEEVEQSLDNVVRELIRRV